MNVRDDADTRNSRGGRPSKGLRVQLATRLMIPLADAARDKAESRGMTVSDYLAMLIAQDTDLLQYAPYRTDQIV